VVLGSVLGAVAFLNPFALPVVFNRSKLLLLFVGSLFLIPLPLMENSAFNIFAFNAPSRPLFWEYVTNEFYALVLYAVNRRILFALTVLVAAGICYKC
jgi:hypothetical protein